MGGRIRSYNNLANPWDLTWCHKELISSEFVADNNGRYTHFVYLEGDIRLSFANFCYWLQARQLLRAHRLIPAFVRVEYQKAGIGFTTSDAFWPVYVPAQSNVRIDDVAFVNMPNPYNPLYILDIYLAKEYANSPAFNQEASKSLCQWGTAERAAMGLCLENVPAPFQSRYVVPVSAQTNMIPTFAQVSHLPNNYADNPTSPLGKVRIDTLFVGADEADDGNVDAQSEWRRFSGTGTQSLLNGIGSRLPLSEDRYYLVSDHDTIMYIDHKSLRLKHAPFGIAPWNLALELPDSAPLSGRLLTIGDSEPDLYQAFVASSDGNMRLEIGRGDSGFDVVQFSDGTVAIRKDNLFLAADQDGFARVNRPHCRQWERFRLVRTDTIAAIALMRRYSWLSESDRRIAALKQQPIYFECSQTSEASALAATLAPGAVEHRRKLVFGPARIALVGKEQIVRIEHSDRGKQVPPIHMDIADGSGSVHRFSRFSPLVHYYVGGDDSDCRFLKISLTSLAERGRYRGPISIKSERPREELLQYIPEEFRSRLIVSLAAFRDGSSDPDTLDPDLESLYRPILLCRTNIVFESDVGEMLIDALLAGRASLKY